MQIGGESKITQSGVLYVENFYNVLGFEISSIIRFWDRKNPFSDEPIAEGKVSFVLPSANPEEDYLETDRFFALAKVRSRASTAGSLLK